MTTTIPTSSQSQNVLDAHLFCLLQVSRDHLPCLIRTRHVQHGLVAAVVQSRTGYRHGASLLVSPRVSGWVPCDITEQGPSGKHPVKPVYQVHCTGCCSWREKLQREEAFSIGDLSLCMDIIISIYTY